MKRSLVLLLYRCATYLYPPGFRKEVGAELLQTFSERFDETIQTGDVRGPIRLLRRTVRDVIITSMAEWRDVFARSGPWRAKIERPVLSHVQREAKYALRMLKKNPGTSSAAIVTLTFGIALTTTMYAIGTGFLTPLPFPDADQIVHIGPDTRINPRERRWIRSEDFAAWRSGQTSFTALAAYRVRPANIGRMGTLASRVELSEVTPGTFNLLQSVPLFGRLLREDDGVSGNVALISHDVWSDLFAGDSNVVGQTIRVDGEIHTVVGVMSPGFGFPYDTGVWRPLDLSSGVMTSSLPLSGWLGGLEVVGRIRRDVSREAAQQELARIWETVQRAGVEREGPSDILVQPFVHRYLDETANVLMYLMLLATVAVLIIACFNVANLLLARAIVRTRELAIRSALGASRRAIVFSLLAESTLLATVGAVFGVILALLAVQGIDRAVAIASLPFWINFGLNIRVLVFAVSITVLSGMLAGTLPAIQATRTDVHGVLQDETRGSTGFRIGRLSNLLVVGEVILSCALLLGCGFISKNIISVATAEIRYETRNILTARVALTSEKYQTSEARATFLNRLQDELMADPRVAVAAVSTQLPAAGRAEASVQVEGQVPESGVSLPRTRTLSMSNTFLETFRLEVLNGEAFDTQSYRGGSGVVMINESFAAEAFPGQNPVGKRVKTTEGGAESGWLTIVGVLPNLWIPGALVEQDGEWCLYYPLISSSHVFLSVRGSVDDAPLLQLMRQGVANLDADLALTDVFTMKFFASRHLLFYLAFGAAFVISGIISLFLAIVGLYAVISFSVTRRSHEMGIRMALGAGGWSVIRLVMRQGTRKILFGLLAGTLLGTFLARGLVAILTTMDPSMSSVKAVDPLVFGIIVTVIGITGVTACVLPARRATRVDPMTAFRAD